MSQQSQEQYQFISTILSKHIGAKATIDDLQFFYGGNFNLAVRVKTGTSEYFIKWTQGEHRGLFEAEANNLQLIQKTEAIDVPSVLGFGSLDEKEYLMMECIQSAEKSADYWSDFGQKLAHLHQHSAVRGHGLDYDNYLGAAKQVNDWEPQGVQFFILNRLKKQVDNALYDRKISSETEAQFEALYESMVEVK